MLKPDLRALAGGIAMSVAAGTCMGGETMVEADQKAVALLDIQYQAAVERNDAAAMALIHHENMTLVLSNGTVVTGKQLEQLARKYRKHKAPPRPKPALPSPAFRAPGG